MMQNRCKTLLCSASKLRIYSRRQEQQFLQNGVVAMSFVSSSSSFSGGVWGRRRVIRESFVDDDVAFQRGRMRSLCCHRCCGNNDNNNARERTRVKFKKMEKSAETKRVQWRWRRWCTKSKFCAQKSQPLEEIIDWERHSWKRKNFTRLDIAWQ